MDRQFLTIEKVILTSDKGEEEVFYKSSDPNERLPFEFCKKIINQNGGNYSDAEIKVMVDYLYQVAEINLKCFEKKE